MSLEDEIESLTELDALRVRSGTLRDEGRKALRNETIKWESAGDGVEDALVVRALCQRGPDGPPKDLVQKLEELQLGDFLSDQRDSVPILRAARGMQALVAAPDSAFSQSSMFFYYWVVRELYSADAPDWAVGGARAGDAGSPTAFITGECIRAVLGFVRTLRNTGTLVGGIGELFEQERRSLTSAMPRDWLEVEKDRLHRHFHTTILALSGNICLRLPALPNSVDRLDSYLDQFPGTLIDALDFAISTFKTIGAELARLRAKEERKAKGDVVAEPRFDRTASGHRIAYRSLERAVQNAEVVAQFQLFGFSRRAATSSEVHRRLSTPAA